MLFAYCLSELMSSKACLLRKAGCDIIMWAHSGLSRGIFSSCVNLIYLKAGEKCCKRLSGLPCVTLGGSAASLTADNPSKHNAYECEPIKASCVFVSRSV